MTWTVYATPLMTLATHLGSFIGVSTFMSTGDWDVSLSPLEWESSETSEVPKECYSGGDSIPLVLGIPTISFQ